ncbi:hypothetical protein BpHYR1_000805 [Brachionus plicatilis]|uniref:Uncharacterized protein n=1 Tax=Brachionus plicatilis TaxID=10195 RepID=A0A3M7PJB8_BRAPC|nr:hypothetical protein BpHYR1_000805 [Brachionus plicatilis]
MLILLTEFTKDIFAHSVKSEQAQMMNKRLVKVLKVLLVFNLSLFFCAYVQILDIKSDYLAIRTHENQFLSSLERELVAESNKSANWTTGSIFDVLFAHKAFLVQVDILIQIKKFNDSKSLNFGIFSKEFFGLVKNFEKIQCKCDVVYAKYENLSIPSAAYGFCDGLLLHVSAFYQRANFFWIPGDDMKIEPKFFNDKTRALSSISDLSHCICKISLSENHNEKNIKQYLDN